MIGSALFTAIAVGLTDFSGDTGICCDGLGQERFAMKTFALDGVVCCAFVVVTAFFSSSAKAETDACALLTAAQVSASAGFPVGAGTHVTPTFVKTCTWTGPSGGGTQIVTLNLQTGSFFDGAKRQSAIGAAAGGPGVLALKPAGVGDDSFFIVEGTQVMLWVKKGGNAFKLAVYKEIPVDQKEAIELALAKQVVPRL